MMNLKSALVVAAMMSVGAGFAQAEARPAETQSAQRAPAATTTRKGVIKTITEEMVVVTPNDNKKAQLTFLLTPDTKRTGTLAEGEAVAVTYYLDKSRPVVTAVTGKEASKQDVASRD